MKKGIYLTAFTLLLTLFIIVLYRIYQSPQEKVLRHLLKFGKEENSRAGFQLESYGYSHDIQGAIRPSLILKKEMVISVPEASSIVFEECNRLNTMMNNDKKLAQYFPNKHLSYNSNNISIYFIENSLSDFSERPLFSVDNIWIIDGELTLAYYIGGYHQARKRFPVEEYQEFMRTGKYPFLEEQTDMKDTNTN